jgi:hypothetical protein
MLKRHAMLLPAAALVMTFATAVPSMAEDDGCDTAKLADVVKAANVSGDDASAAVQVVAFYAENACAVGRQDIAMVRGMMSDAYGALSGDDAKAALAAAKALADNVGMGCDKDGSALMVLDACTLDDVQKAASGGM